MHQGGTGKEECYIEFHLTLKKNIKYRHDIKLKFIMFKLEIVLSNQVSYKGPL